jgi:hypothetical protein
MAASWAPPAPDALVSVEQPDPSLIPLVEHPKRSRKGMWVGIAAASALVVGGGGGAMWAMRGGDEPSVQAFSIEAVAQSAEQVDAVELEMTLEMGDATIEAMVTIDSASGLMSMTMDVGELLGDEAGVGTMEMIMDLDTGTGYMSTDAFGELIETDAGWVAADLGEGMGDQFDQLAGSNPFDMAPLFDQEGVAVEEIGFDEVNGEKVKHYEVTIDPALLAEQSEELGDQFGELGDLGFTDGIAFQVYVNEANELRRMSFSMDILGESISYDMTVVAIGDEIEPIVLPDPADVVTEEELMGG